MRAENLTPVNVVNGLSDPYAKLSHFRHGSRLPAVPPRRCASKR